MIGWMNNWQYAQSIPTAPWRSAMSVPREITLRTIDGRPQLVQHPIRRLAKLRLNPGYYLARRTIAEGTQTLADARATGKALDIVADFDARDAARFGLKVRVGNGQETVIGYDAAEQEVYVDRTRSGIVDFSPDFPGIQRAPLAAPGGNVHLRVLVDWSSVEVFADDGRPVITDQIFPDASSIGVQLFSEGGSTTLHRLAIWQMRPMSRRAIR
jgi:levanase